MAEPDMPAIDAALAIVQQVVDQAVKDWLSDKGHSPAALRKRVMNTLNEHIREIGLVVLGANNTWGEWRLDRAKPNNSPIARYVVHIATQSCDEWLLNVLDPMLKDIKVPDELVKDLMDVYWRTFKDRVREKIVKLAEEHAAKMVVELTEKLDKGRKLLGGGVAPKAEDGTQ